MSNVQNNLSGVGQSYNPQPLEQTGKKSESKTDSKIKTAIRKKVGALNSFSKQKIRGNKILPQTLIVGAKLAVFVSKIFVGGPRVNYADFNTAQADSKSKILEECQKNGRKLNPQEDFIFNPGEGINFREYNDIAVAVDTNNLKLLDAIVTNSENSEKHVLNQENNEGLKKMVTDFRDVLRDYNNKTPKTWT